MRTPLKIFLFITLPIWILPAVFFEMITGWWKDFSEWVDENV